MSAALPRGNNTVTGLPASPPLRASAHIPINLPKAQLRVCYSTAHKPSMAPYCPLESDQSPHLTLKSLHEPPSPASAGYPPCSASMVLAHTGPTMILLLYFLHLNVFHLLRKVGSSVPLGARHRSHLLPKPWPGSPTKWGFFLH